MSRRVLLATRPLVPPWDEASKNFAYFLGREVQNHSLTLLTTKEKLSGLPTSAIEEPIFESSHLNLTAKIRLFRFLRKMRRRFDITHYLFTPTKQSSALIKLLAKPLTGKTIQTVATLREDLYSPTELRSLLFADHLTVYTNLTKQKLENLGFQNVTCIYPGIDLNLYSPKEKDPAVLKTYNLSHEHFLAIYPGEYTRLGATDILFDGWVEYFQKNPETNIRFLFACRIKNEADRAKRAELQQKVTELNLQSHILFQDTHATTNMAALYNTADVVLFPVENLRGKFDVPLVIIEAYACGKPVILSDLPEFREFSNPQICVTIPRGSKEPITDSVAYLSQNTDVSAKIGRAARAFVEEHFDLQKTARAYEDLYTSL